MDTVDRETRSRMMSGIRSKNTKPEVLVRVALHKMGFRYRKNVRSLPGTPDIVLKKYRAVIFVHGCFWHGHDCHYFKTPATRTDFWMKKIIGNQLRDKQVLKKLRESGWRTRVVWECSLRGSENMKKLEKLIDKLASWIMLGSNI